MCLIDSNSFFIIHVFEVKESIFDIRSELPYLSYFENPGQLPVQEDLRGTDDFVLWILTISSVFMFFEVKESIYDIPTELPCLCDLIKSRSTSGSRGTDDSVLYIFEISSLFVFSRSMNPLLIFLPSCPTYLGDLKNPGQLSVQEVLRGTDDFVLWIFTISSVFMFLRSRNPLLTFLQSYHVWVTSKIQVNFRFNRYSEVLVVVSYRFSQFLHPPFMF